MRVAITLAALFVAGWVFVGIAPYILLFLVVA